MEKIEAFRDKDVLITGGLGFIGSNLAIELVRLGAKVTIVDNMLPRQGGNLFNINDIVDKVTVNISDGRTGQPRRQHAQPASGPGH
jgi:UDP-glucose 4-epimerase